MAGSKEYSVVLALRADDKVSSPLRAVGERLKQLRGHMSAVGRDAGMAKAANEVNVLKGALGGLAGLNGSLGGLLGPLVALGGGGLTFASLFDMAKGAAESGDALGEMSDRLGISGQSIREWQHAAMRAGASNEDLESGFNKLTTNIGQAVNGVGKAKDVFEALGLKLKDSNGKVKATDTVMAELAGKMEAITDPAQRAAVASVLLGKQAGIMLAPMLAKGRDGLREWFEEARSFGTVTEDQIAAAGKFMDSMDTLGKVTKGLSGAIGNRLIPIFQPLVEASIQWIKVNKEIVAVGLSEVVAFLVDIFSTLGSAISWAVDAVGGAARAFELLAGFLAVMALAFAPVTLAVMTFAGAAFVIWKYWAPIKAFFVGIWGDVKPAWEAFFTFASDALNLWLVPLRTAFELASQLFNLVTGKGWDSSGLEEIGKGAKEAAERMMNGAASDVGGKIGDAAGNVSGRVKSAWQSLTGGDEAKPADVVPLSDLRPEARPSDVVQLPQAKPGAAAIGGGDGAGGSAGGVSSASGGGSGSGAPSLAAQAANVNRAEVLLRIISDAQVKVESVRQQGAGLTTRLDLDTGRSRAGTG